TVALGEQRAILRRQVVDQPIEAAPEGRGFDAGAGQHFVFDEALQVGRDLQAAQGYTFAHDKTSSFVTGPCRMAAGCSAAGATCAMAAPRSTAGTCPLAQPLSCRRLRHRPWPPGRPGWR